MNITKSIMGIAGAIAIAAAIPVYAADKAAGSAPNKPFLKIDRAALSFGRVRPGAISSAQDFVLLNTAGVPLRFMATGVTGPFKVVANDCGKSLGPGRSCRISVTYHPTGELKSPVKPQTGKLMIADDAANSPQELKLTGIADPDAPVAAAASAGLARPTGIAVDSSGKTYVANSSSNTIAVYAAGCGAGSGLCAPIATIGGPHTGIIGPNGVALDSGLNIYVANVAGGPNRRGSISMYKPGSNGDSAPFATIAGTKTGLANPQGVAIDSSGNMYVANAIGGAARRGSVTVYPAHANGDLAPIATIGGKKTGLDEPSGVAFDSAGNIYVANTGAIPSHPGSITVYRADAKGNAAPIATIIGAETGLHSPEGIAVDSSGSIYVANFNGNSVTVYAPGCGTGLSPCPPIFMIAGVFTGLAEPTGIALDAAGNIYVTNQGRLPSAGPYTVTIYSAGSTGAAAPIAIIGAD